MTASSKSTRKAEKALAKTGGASAERQIFLCAISEKQKCCRREEGKEAWNYLKKRLKDLGLVGREGTVQRTKADCLQICEAGPIAVVWPDNVWYHSCGPVFDGFVVTRPGRQENQAHQCAGQQHGEPDPQGRCDVIMDRDFLVSIFIQQGQGDGDDPDSQQEHEPHDPPITRPGKRSLFRIVEGRFLNHRHRTWPSSHRDSTPACFRFAFCL